MKYRYIYSLYVCLNKNTLITNLRRYYLIYYFFMAAREKIDDSARRMEYLDNVEYAHKYEKLDRENVPHWICNFQSSIVKVLSASHTLTLVKFRGKYRVSIGLI